MILNIFAIRDRATVQYGTPMFLISAGQAMRSFQDEVNRSAAENLIFNHPEDYDLYSLGEFDTNTGLFKSDVPEQILTGKAAAIRN